MDSPSEPWLGIVLVVLFGLLLFFRIRFSHVSKGLETAALAASLMLLLLVGHVFLTARQPPARPAGQVIPTRDAR